VRILMLTQWFDPEPTFKGLEFARKLAARRHEVEVLTGFPNYPGGKLYPGYRVRPWQRESIDGISIVRVPLYPSHDRSALRRAWNYLSFALAATLLGPFLLRRPDVIYAYHPPGTIGLPALVLRRWFRAPVVYDVQDLWPDTIASTGMLRAGGPAMRVLDRFCRFVYRRADRVVVLSPGFRDTLIQRGVAADQLDVIYNWAPEQQPEPAAAIAQRTDTASRFTVVFAGTMGLAQGLDAVLDAAARCTATVPQARFLMVGGGVDQERLAQLASDRQLPNVEFTGRLPLAATQALLKGADALLVHLKDDLLFTITIPSKTQAYLAAGKPVIVAVRGDTADLVSQAGAGVVAEPGNPESIANAVRRMAEMTDAGRARMGRAGSEFYQRELAIERAVEKFEAVFHRAGEFRYARKPRAKRLFDIAASAAALLALWPVIAIVAILVRLQLGSPVIFRQVRPGWKGRPFPILKFRTMREGSGSDSDRLTSFGRFLRRTSLDELPELWNVLRGDMSLVGPRPLLMDYFDFFTDRERKRFVMPPGITGWAQIHGRNQAPWDERLERDVWYIEHWKFALDLQILASTVMGVLRADGVEEDPRTVMLDLNQERSRP